VSERAPAGLLLTFARRGEDDAILQAIARLREHGVNEIASVGTPVSAPALRELGVGDIIPYGEGHGAQAVIGELRRRRPRMAAIVYWDSGFAGHLKLEMLALLSGARHVWRVAADAPAETIGRAELAWIVLLKGLRACGCSLAGAAICGAAFLCLRTRQLLAGGSGASRI
jgi:hypothetical protein